jgi:tetrahydromethanopterin S-methyltransferase subunit F
MIKLARRTRPLIESANDSGSDWLGEYASNLAKVSVQSRRQDENLYDQISSIISGNKSKHSSVEAAVDDMKERSGLLAHQNKMRSLAQAIKTAGEKEPEIKVFKLCPQVKDTLNNYIDETHGNLPIPAVISWVKRIHHKDISDDAAWTEDALLTYINDRGIAAKKMHPDMDDSQNANLGKLPHYDDREIDPSNNDALFSLTPANVR